MFHMSQPNFENFKGKEACRLDKRKYKFYASREKKNTHIQLISSGQNKTQVKKKLKYQNTQLILLDKNTCKKKKKKNLLDK